MNYAYLLLGSNLGSKSRQLSMAITLLEERCGKVVDRSPVYETAPWGNTEQDNFLNQAVVVETSLSPQELMHEILHIEQLMGRDRNGKYAPRTIDIDIIFYNHRVIDEPGLTLPHPRMQERRFVLAPLSEVAPAYIHPVLHRTVEQLLRECADTLEVKKSEPV